MEAATDPPVRGLREQKRLATRRAVHMAAVGLVVEGGMGAVTVDKVAQRAGISRRTFFNHFSGIDDALTNDDPDRYDRLIALLLQRPVDEPVLDSIEAVAGDWVKETHADPQLKAMRRRAAHASPEYAALLSRVNSDFVVRLVDALEEARAPGTSRLDLAITVGAAFAMVRTCLAHHSTSEQSPDLGDLLAHGFDVLRRL